MVVQLPHVSAQDTVTWREVLDVWLMQRTAQLRQQLKQLAAAHVPSIIEQLHAIRQYLPADIVPVGAMQTTLSLLAVILFPSGGQLPPSKV